MGLTLGCLVWALAPSWADAGQSHSFRAATNFQEAGDQVTSASSCTAARIMPSPVLSAALKQRIESELQSLCEYLARVGIKPDPRPIEIAFNPRLIDTAYYRKVGHRIEVASALAVDTEVILRQYVHFALHSVVTDEVRPVYLTRFQSIHSGLVNYFLASFHGDPVSKGIICKSTLDVSHVRRLDNDHTYRQLPSKIVWTEKRDILSRVWGGVFWDIRREVGQEKADRILLNTLRSVQRRDLQADSAARFRQELLAAGRQCDGAGHVSAIENILELRKIPTVRETE